MALSLLLGSSAFAGCASGGAGVPAGSTAASSVVGVPAAATRPITPTSAAGRAARARGRTACIGQTPGKVIERALPAAEHKGAPEGLLTLADRPPKRFKSSTYARLAGAIYAYSLPESRHPDGAAGCADALEKTLSKSTKGTNR